MSGVDPDGNKYSIPYLVKKYNLQFDEYGNLKGVNIPEYNRINGTEDDTVKYAKQRAQIQYYAKDVYGTGKFGRGELLNRLKSTGSIWSGVGRAQELYKRHKSYDFSDVSGIDPDSNKYSIPYLVKKYKIEQKSKKDLIMPIQPEIITDENENKSSEDEEEKKSSSEEVQLPPIGQLSVNPILMTRLDMVGKKKKQIKNK